MGLVLSDAAIAAGVADVRLWGHDPARVASIAATREAPERLPGFRLPDAVEVIADSAAALAGATLVLNAVPTQYIRATWSGFGEQVPAGAGVMCVSKGLEIETRHTPTAVLHACVGGPSGRFGALSGPTIAMELARRLPATMVAAGAEPLARRTQEIFNAKWLRIYRHDDLVGVELAGAVKNVIALAAGIVDGLEVGSNAKSALLARGLAEMARLGAALGARVDTFFGVAGVGDLATTCFSPFGRNRTCGERLGRGESVRTILDSTVSVVEGVPTTKAVTELAREHGVEMPITNAVHAVLFDGLDPMDAIWSLMQREANVERVG